jgi:hypothetical protein
MMYTSRQSPLDQDDRDPEGSRDRHGTPVVAVNGFTVSKTRHYEQ